jgi:hypothetical protein
MQLEQLIDFPEQVLKVMGGLLALVLIIFCAWVGSKGFSLFFVHIQGKGMPGVRFQHMKGLLPVIWQLEKVFGKGLIGIVGDNCRVVDNSIFLSFKPRGLIMGHGTESECRVVDVIVQNKGEEFFVFFTDAERFLFRWNDISAMLFIGIIDKSVDRPIGPFFKISLDKRIILFTYK